MSHSHANRQGEDAFIVGLRRPSLSKATYATVEQLAGYFEDNETIAYWGEPHPVLSPTATRLFRPRVVEHLIRHAHWLMVREPPKAKTVAKLAIEIAARVHDTSVRTSARALLLEGKANYEYAAALLRVGQYCDAETAVTRARHLLAMPETIRLVTDEVALLDLVRGQILHFLGRSEEGLRVIEHAADYLLVVCDDRKKYVKARTIAATILMRLKRFDEADLLLGQTIVSAVEEHDRETAAHMLCNIAVCAAEKGDEKRAEKCHEQAVSLFEELGMLAEVPRARRALITIMQRRGKFLTAISEMYKARNEYLNLGMPIVAARLSMDIAELLIQMNRYSEAEHLCEGLVDVFLGAELQREVARALEYLQACASEKELSNAAIEVVKRFLDLISSDEGTLFAPRLAEGRP
jgi:tetratricopeptide (TPR) repeat protein